MKRSIMVAALAAATALCTPAMAQERGGTLNFARYDGSRLIDPIYADRNPDIWMVGSLFDTLLRPSADGNSVVAGLAESHSVSADGKIVTLTLQDGLKFSDGSALTGDDVVFSLDRARNGDLSPWAGLLGSIETVAAEGNTITLGLKNPDPTILSMLSTFNTAIVSKAAFDAAAGATDQEKSAAIFAATSAGVGSGPFYLCGFEQGATMDFCANEHYWKMGADGKALPYLDKVHFEIIPDDATRILKLQAGEVDLAEFIPFSRVAELEADPAVNMNLYPSTRIIYSPINTRDTRADGSANPLIAEAGVPAGTEITLTTLAGSADDATIFAALQQMWAPLGLNVKVEQVDGATRGAKNRSGEFDIHTYGWVNDVNDPSQVAGWLGYHPTRKAVGTGWNNPEFNTLFEASSVEIDPAKRADQYAKMQDIYAEAAPLLFMYETPFAVAVSTKVEGYVQTPLGNNIFEGASVSR